MQVTKIFPKNVNSAYFMLWDFKQFFTSLYFYVLFEVFIVCIIFMRKSKAIFMGGKLP